MRLGKRSISVKIFYSFDICAFFRPSIAVTTCRHIIVTKQWPIPTGGGLGVARQFFLGLAEMDFENHDVWAICGPDVVQVKDEKTCRHLADEGSKRPKENRFVATFRQIQAIRRLEVPGTTVIAFTPFYAWPVLRLICPRLRLIHVEQSKGGRHHELAALYGHVCWKTSIVRVAVSLNFLFPHTIVFPSRGARALFARNNSNLAHVVERKGRVIYNGVETFLAKSRCQSNTLRIISVCEDIPVKALDACLQVIAILVEAGYAVKFDHFGTVRVETRKFVETRCLPVIFHGLRPREEVIAAMAEADLFLHLPIVAVFDLVLIEAMSAGLLVVASPVGGNTEALGENYQHFANSPHFAVAEIQAIIKFPESAERTRQALRTRAEAYFTSTAMAADYLKL